MDYIVGVVFVIAFTLERFRFVAVRDLEKFEPNVTSEWQALLTDTGVG